MPVPSSKPKAESETFPSDAINAPPREESTSKITTLSLKSTTMERSISFIEVALACGLVFVLEMVSWLFIRYFYSLFYGDDTVHILMPYTAIFGTNEENLASFFKRIG